MTTRKLIVFSYVLIIPVVVCYYLGILGNLGDGGYRRFPEIMSRVAAGLALIQLIMIAILKF